MAATSITRKQDEATGKEIAQLRAEVATLKQAILGVLPNRPATLRVIVDNTKQGA